MQPLPCSHSFPGWDGSLIEAPAVVWNLMLSDLGIAIVYAVLTTVFFLYATSKRGAPPFPEMILLLALIFASCGATHIFNIIVLFTPSFWGESWANWMTVGFSVLGFVFWKRRYHGIIDYSEANSYMRRYVQRQQEELATRLDELERHQRQGNGV